MNSSIVIRSELSPQKSVTRSIDNFLKAFEPHEVKMGTKLPLYFDERSKAYYLMCHLAGNVLAQYCDLEASLAACPSNSFKQA